ncbi:MAG: hypothetical protein ABIN57_09145 [Chitinophagaceae bacterium]
MKTLLNKMMLPWEWLLQPAGEEKQKLATPKKRKSVKPAFSFLSPECSNVRGGRKDDSRKMPAP